MLTTIDNIVFDLGGVVIDLHRERCIEEFEKLGYADAGKDLDLYVQAGPFLALETGRITSAEFFSLVRRKCRQDTTDKDIQNAFNAFLVALPKERLRALLALREKYRVFGLSNTNPVMYDSWISMAFSVDGLRIDDYFEGVVKSFAEGVCKPDPAIFATLIRRYNLEPSRTLYLDDSPANCHAAESLGLHTELVSEDNTMLQIISRLA